MVKRFCRVIVSLFLCGLLSGCDVLLYFAGCPRRAFSADQQDTFFSSERYTRLDELIRTDGYYLRDTTITSNPPEAQLIFFGDGTAANFWFAEGKDSLLRGVPHINLSAAIDYEGRKRVWSFGSCYAMRGDTICVNDYFVYLCEWVLQRRLFKVVDRETIELVTSQWVYKEKYELNDPIYERHWTYKFIPAENIPKPDVPLKEKKWMWRDKTEWKNYMSGISKKRKTPCR